MKQADDPALDYADLVRQGYDRCAGAYHEARRGSAVLPLSPLEGRLPTGAAVLDSGCGAGVPVTRELAQRFSVTGVDISGEMVRLARANVPDARFIHADIMTVDLPPASFDAAVAFYSVYHLPREKQGALFRRLAAWVKPGGFLLATLSIAPSTSDTLEDLFGAPMYWSHYGLTEYRTLLDRAGFDVLSLTFVGHGYSADYDGPDEHHPLILARRRPDAG